MSCLQSVTAYLEAKAEEEKNQIGEETLECLRSHEERRNQELYSFIDDFVASEEYAEYINEKRNIAKCSAATQCDPSEIMVESKRQEAVDKYPLTAAQKKMFAFKRHFEKYAEKQERDASVKKQERSIQIIKAKISEARKVFECTSEQKQKEKDKFEHQLMEQCSAKFGIDLDSLSSRVQLKLLDRFKRCHQDIIRKAKQRQSNLVKILEKLVREYKQKKAPRQLRTYKIQPAERILDDMVVMGFKIERPAEPQPEVADAATEAVEPVVVKPKKKTEKKPKPIKEKKVGKKKAPKVKKLKGKHEKHHKGLVLPIIPVVNPREQLLPENIDNIVDLLEEFRDLDCCMENQDMLQSHGHVGLGETSLNWEPSTVMFENFDPNKVYRRTVKVLNVSSQIKKVRFLRLDFPNEFDRLVFDVENFGIQKLYTGCHARFSVKFQPYDGFKQYSGKLILLSFDTHFCQYSQLEIGIHCVPKHSQLKIDRDTVHFGSVPVWKAAAGIGGFKLVKFLNEGVKPCTVCIRKVGDPLDLESMLEEGGTGNLEPAPLGEVMDILNQCLDNIDNHFRFESCFFRLRAKEEKSLKVWFKNASYTGDYFERYMADVYEGCESGELELSGCQTISLYAVTTGHFLATHPEILDFGVCMMNCCYQLSFELCNESKNTQAISVRVPANLKDMVQSGTAMIYMPPKSQRTIFVKLYPRELLNEGNCPQFDKSNSILAFNLHLYVASKPLQDYPAVKVRIYAIVTNFDDLTISCASTRHMSNFLNTVLIDVGDCSIYETIWTEIHLTNNTAVMQVCGFMDLPQAVVLVPNFGFCKLFPGQQRKFKLYISPEIRDFPSYSIGSLRNSHYFFKLRVETVASMGQIVQGVSEKVQTASSDMGKQLTLNDIDLFASMTGIVPDMKRHSQFVATDSMMLNKDHGISRNTSPAPSTILDSRQASDQSDTSMPKEVSDVDTVLNFQNFLIVETNSRREVWLKMNLKRPLLEFSHQFVEFPDTAAGSYSTMEVTLSALEREIEKVCLDKKLTSAYKARFYICGDSQEILVQPSCGSLQGGESMKIILLAKPNVPKEIVEQTAKSIKRSEIYERKLKERELTRHATRGKSKEKKGKKATDSSKKKQKKAPKQAEKPKEAQRESHPDIVAEDDEISIQYLDLYPAEMVYWRSLEPYYIKANFTCIIDYETTKVHKKRDKLYLEAICKVVRPDFSTDLSQQRIDFGCCLIGMTQTRTVTIQNITYQDITPQMSMLNPIGCFSAPDIRAVPSESCLEIPISFSPTTAEKLTEFVEIRSNATAIPLVLCGEGVVPVIKVTPEFSVFRLKTKPQKLAELHLKIENGSDAPALVNIEKLFEIEARLEDLKHDTVNEGKKSKNAKEPKEAAKFSDSLTEKELAAIESCFSKVIGQCHFDLKATGGGALNVPPSSTSTVTVLCGYPELLEKRHVEGSKKEKKTKGKSEDKSSSRRSEGAEQKGLSQELTFPDKLGLRRGHQHMYTVCSFDEQLFGIVVGFNPSF